MEHTVTRIIGIGVIGMGWMGEVHSRAYRALPDRFHDSGAPGLPREGLTASSR